MQKSESIVNLASALIKAQAEFPEVPKSKEVVVQSQRGSYVFKYAPLEKMLPKIRPVLLKYGLGFTQGVEGDRLVTTLLHESGEWIAHSMPLQDQPTAQMYGSQITYRRRYSLKAALGIETDDDDADNAFVDDGKKRKISPTEGILNEVSAERKEVVNRLAGSIIDCFNADKPNEAYKAFLEITDQWERAAVWTMLDRKMKRAIRDLDAIRKESENVKQG